MVFESFVNRGKTYTVTTRENHAEVIFDIFPFHMALEIWVKAHNQLGQIESEHLSEYAGFFGKLIVLVLFR